MFDSKDFLWVKDEELLLDVAILFESVKEEEQHVYRSCLKITLRGMVSINPISILRMRTEKP